MLNPIKKLNRALATRPQVIIFLQWISITLSLLLLFAFLSKWEISSRSETFVSFMLIGLPLGLTPLALWGAVSYMKAGYLKPNTRLLFFTTLSGVISFLVNPTSFMAVKIWSENQFELFIYFWIMFLFPIFSLIGFVQLIRVSLQNRTK
ncbi:hypothetical protein [Brevibacillus reuszeri]|uniref:hypothetical protein n=1 Tax=Brevibacillus reuszeri TaxID=54915 RepID=UPI003D1F56EE